MAEVSHHPTPRADSPGPRPDEARRRAVFLDRDGTLLEEVGYLNHISRFHLYPFAAEAVRRLKSAGLAVVVVTNQSGVARGYFPEALVQEVNARLVAELAAQGAHLDGVYYCPHKSEDQCACRKPRTGMLDRAAREHNLLIPGSFVVGDRHADVGLAHNAGCRSIFVLTGYGRGDWTWNRETWSVQPHHVVENLAEAVDVILKEKP